MNRLNIKVAVLAFKKGTCGKAEVAYVFQELLTGTDESFDKTGTLEYHASFYALIFS